MGNQEIFTSKRNKEKGYPVLAAEKFIHLFSDGLRPNQEQQAMLAAAYFVLATEQNQSISRSIVHLNSAISLLKHIPYKHQKPEWGSQLANAYFKRAECHEEKQNYTLAYSDYYQCIQMIESTAHIKDKDRLLLARSALSIADLLAHEQIHEGEPDPIHPLYFVNKAIHQLSFLKNPNDEILSTYAYAHQTAGLCLGPAYFPEATKAYHAALLSVFKSKQLNISPLLSDIYTCMGLLYEQNYYYNCIEKKSDILLDHAMIYFGISLVFNYSQAEPDNDVIALESLFEIIYRVLDPYLPATSVQTVFHLIDALIYAYRCIIEHILPNEALVKQFSHPEALNTFVQHIYWLVLECHKKSHPREYTLDLIGPKVSSLKITLEDIEKILSANVKDNIVLFPTL